MSKFIRADQYLVEQGLCASRTQAKRLIETNAARYGLRTHHEPIEWHCITKPSQALPTDCVIDLPRHCPDMQFVSRGGIKLAAALAHLQLLGWSVQHAICLDIGQSTGGFTDCLLTNGASHVVGVDVGSGQLAEPLQKDPRVTAFENINARTITPKLLESIGVRATQFDVIVMDVSFISQTLILPQLPPLLHPDGILITLVKPQFELDKGKIGKGGIVRDTAHHEDVRTRLRTAIASLHLKELAWLDSPIYGGDGNQEFLLCAQKKKSERYFHEATPPD